MGSSNYSNQAPQQHQQVNSQALQGVMGTAGNFENFLKSLMSQQGPQVGQPGQVAAGPRPEQVTTDPQAATNAFLSLNPQLQGIAQQSAQSALDPYGRSASELASQVTRDSMRATADALGAGGLLNSGAANMALLEAVYRPQAALTTDLASKQADYQMAALQNLQGLTAGGLNQGYAGQLQAGLSSAQNQLNYGNQLLSAQQVNAQNQLAADQLNQQLWAQRMNMILGGWGNLGGMQASAAGLTQPQLVREPGALDYMQAGAGLLGGAAALINRN